MKTLQSEWRDLHDALVDAGAEIGKSLGIHRILNWLEGTTRMNIDMEVSTLNPYWVFYCEEHGIDPLVKLRTYCDFVGWINSRHMEFCPGEAIRHTRNISRRL